VLEEPLKNHLASVKEIYEGDVAREFAGAFIPEGGSPVRWNQRGNEWGWQFFFPALRLTRVKQGKEVRKSEDELRRFHAHANQFSAALRGAAGRSGIHKKVSAHTFRHSFANHLFLANYDIKTIQDMLGHSDVRTTMIYLQTVPPATEKERQSPLDMGEPAPPKQK